MGGIWERQIRSARNILTVMLAKNDRRMSSSSFRTLLYEVMAIINSRPLSVENLEDPCSGAPLSPNNLLTHKSNIVTQPAGDFSKLDYRKQWRAVQHYANLFWNRWRSEYLSAQQSRQKWKSSKPNLKVNDVVILHDDNAMRTEWSLGKVVDVCVGCDGLVRSVKVQVVNLDAGHSRTAAVLHRPIHKVTYLTE
jgi:hypothetical protein